MIYRVRSLGENKLYEELKVSSTVSAINRNFATRYRKINNKRIYTTFSRSTFNNTTFNKIRRHKEQVDPHTLKRNVYVYGPVVSNAVIFDGM